jgi:hypothetical protein
MDCSCCGDSRVGLLGILGKLAWYECRACGMKFSSEHIEVPEVEEEVSPWLLQRMMWKRDKAVRAARGRR